MLGHRATGSSPIHGAVTGSRRCRDLERGRSSSFDTGLPIERVDRRPQDHLRHFRVMLDRGSQTTADPLPHPARLSSHG